MLKDIHPKRTTELYATPIVQQTAYWSAVKSVMGERTLALDFKAQRAGLYDEPKSNVEITSDILVIIQRIDSGYSMAYVPYGPEIEPNESHQGEFLEELSESLRSYLPKDCIMIRYDLHWESYWAKDNSYYEPDGSWIGPPEPAMQELRFNMNTLNWNFRKAFHNILPSNTIYLDLQKSEDSLMAQMKPKTRYNIRLAERKGVEVRAVGIEDIGLWYQLYKETALRNNLYLNDIKHFEAVLAAKSRHVNSPADVMLLLAEKEGKPLAAMFLIISAHRAYYLYGASSSADRNTMATYALQWEAITMAKKKGCTDYDMFGIAPRPDPSHPMYGLYRFKSGFGGNIYHSIGCWDYPLNVEAYHGYIGRELQGQGYHLS